MSKEDETRFEQAMQALLNGYPVYRDTDWEDEMAQVLGEGGEDEGREEGRRDGAADLDGNGGERSGPV
jgi:hypothetical protein